MIKYIIGNLFESGAQCLVNTVNCEGYMGKGIAYQFKMRFPNNNKDYVRACKSGELHIGSLHHFYEDGTYIVNFPTKDRWREKSKMYYIEEGLDLLVDFIEKKSIISIAIPPLGCGNGGLNWSEVKSLIENKVSTIKDKCDIIIFEPSINYKPVVKKAPKMNVSSLVLLQIRMKLENFGAIRLQKTCFFVNYFLDEEYFKFDKYHYGPYSHAVDIVARNIKEYQQFYGLTNSKDTYDHVYNIICSKNTEEKLKKINPAIDKATDYVNKISDTSMLEGIATVLYLVLTNNTFDEEYLISLFKDWSKDKEKRFSEQKIRECIKYLENTGIIEKNLCNAYELRKTALL